MRKINCDVVVVGTGPGGFMAAKTCAKYGGEIGRSVKLMKREEIVCR